MRLKISLSSKGNISLPKSYNHILQGLIYALLDPSLRKFLHNDGFRCEKRRFKLFTFSRLKGEFRESATQFEFKSPVSLILSSPKADILQSLAEGFLKKQEISLNGNTVFIETINVMPKLTFNGEEEITIKMLSPVTVYSTLKKADGSKKTYYYCGKD